MSVIYKDVIATEIWECPPVHAKRSDEPAGAECWANRIGISINIWYQSIVKIYSLFKGSQPNAFSP